MSEAATVVFVRHGETPWNREDRIQGWAPVGLTGMGREQTRQLGRSLAATYTFDRVVASDLDRSRETAALLYESGVRPAPTYTRVWRERDVGVYQGLTKEELFGRRPQFRVTAGEMGVRARPTGGESMLDLHERVVGGWNDLLGETGPGEAVLVVTHGGPIFTLLGHLTGTDLPTAFSEYSQDNCAITEVRVSPGSAATSEERATVVCQNDLSWRD